jgi:hypothetical protein
MLVLISKVERPITVNHSPNAQTGGLPSKPGHMKIELSKIEVYDALSQETIAFSANVYIDKQLVAKASNDGRGGMTRLDAVSAEAHAVLGRAEEWVKEQPPVGKFPPRNLADYVDKALEPYLEKLDRADFLRDIKKMGNKNLLYGKPYDDMTIVPLVKPIHTLKLTKGGIILLEDKIRANVLPHLKEGQLILNLNLPPEIKTRIGDQYFFTDPTLQQKARVQAKTDDGKPNKKIGHG